MHRCLADVLQQDPKPAVRKVTVKRRNVLPKETMHQWAAKMGLKCQDFYSRVSDALLLTECKVSVTSMTYRKRVSLCVNDELNERIEKLLNPYNIVTVTNYKYLDQMGNLWSHMRHSYR